MLAMTNTGKLQGLEKDGVLQFRGIPFGRAARFMPPAAVEPWEGVREAVTFGAIAPQNPSPLEGMLGAQNEPGSEDCLFLNVFTTGIDDGRRPVMVWIHGGAFIAGSGSVPWYSGANLARRGVVVVTINYRLGALGFLGVESALGSDFAGAGNNGIRDQILALEWVRENIAGFGGDPDNVTIFGESAGGMSVATLLGAPGVASMLRAAIPQSGAADVVLTADTGAAIVSEMLDVLGASGDKLLDATADELLAAQEEVNTRALASGVARLPFAPVVDGVVLPEPPLNAVRAGSAAHVHVLTGTTSDEFNLFHIMERARGPMTQERLVDRVGRVVGADHADDMIDLYRSFDPNASLDDVWCRIGTDLVFRIPAVRMLEAQSQHQPHTYGYEFAYKSTAFEGTMGACHAIDVPFAFDNIDRRGVDFFVGGINDGTRACSAATSSSWLAMAATGTPQHDGVPEWPAYTVDDRSIMMLDSEVAVAHDPGGRAREAWQSLPFFADR
jgi:para-nitrobenzyl esterase